MCYKKEKNKKVLLHTQPVLSYPWVYICEHKNIGKNQILEERGIKANKDHWGSFFHILFDQSVRVSPSGILEQEKIEFG